MFAQIGLDQVLKAVTSCSATLFPHEPSSRRHSLIDPPTRHPDTLIPLERKLEAPKPYKRETGPNSISHQKPTCLKSAEDSSQSAKHMKHNQAVDTGV